MKKIFISILSAVVALTATAQNINVNAVVVCKTDGTRDTIMVAKLSSAFNSSFYGKENPIDDDYIQLSFTLSDNYDITCSCSLTPVGQNAPYNSYGIMLSSNHIDSIPKYSYNGFFDEALYFVDTQQWYSCNYRQYIGRKYEYVYYASDLEQYFSFVPGQNYYARAYYLLDDKVYYSSEIELRAARTLSAVRKYYYSDYAFTHDNILIKIDAAKIFSEHASLFGAISTYKQQLLTKYINQALSTKNQVELQAVATKTEVCDDGTLYILDDLPADVWADALQSINIDLLQSYYLKATVDSVFTGSSVTSSFGTARCILKQIVADEKWEIRDNQYLVTEPDGTTSRPRLAFEINHLVEAGKTYDLTLTFAPNTEDETDSRKTYFYVTIANLDDDGKVPLISDGQRFGTDTLVSNKPVFIAKPLEQKVMTMQYKPTTFTDKLYLQLDHVMSFTSSRNRSKYGQRFRIVGVEVKPHKE